MKDRNENRPGYKETKVGWIPDEWEATQYKHLASFSGGYGFPETLQGTTGNIPFIKVSDMTLSGNEKYITRSNNYVVEETAKENGWKTFSEGSVVFAKVGAALMLNRRRLLTEGTLIDNNMMAAMPTDKTTSLYLYFSLLHIDFGRLVQVGAVPSINQSQIGTIRLSLPPLAEQEKIAEVLGCWDEGIQQLEDLIDQKRLRKKGLMQQLLTGTRQLPEFQRTEDGGQKSAMTQYRFFDYPNDWELPQIKEVAKECVARNKTREPVTVLSCSKHRGFVESSKYFGKQIFSDDTSNYKVIHRGEFGFPSNHIEEGSIGLLSTHDKGIVSPIYTVFKANKDMLPEYLIALFKTETYRHIFEITTNGSVDRRGSLRWNDFKLIRIPQPSLNEQKAIAAVLRKADEEIDLLNAELDALREQKKGLMQKLLTGEIRHPDFRHVA